MPFYLQVEIKTDLSASECEERFVKPISDALAAEGLGRVVTPATATEETDATPGVYEIAVEVSDIEKAQEVKWVRSTKHLSCRYLSSMAVRR